MQRPRLQAFTLVELLVGMTISVILVGLMVGVVNQIGKTVTNASSKMAAFETAQAGFDIMTQKLSDATLNTYYGYDSDTAPTTYIRKSDLHFYIAQNADLNSSPINSPANANSGHSIYFQAPEGYSNTSTVYANTPGLLNACGYFVEFGPDSTYRPALFTTNPVRYRYRLMQAIQSTENNIIYSDKEGASAEAPPWASNANPWIVPLNNLALPIADNVIALIILNPALDTAGNLVSPAYTYNSRQGIPLPLPAPSPASGIYLQSEQMPPVLQVSMVAIDETSALRLDTGNGTAPNAIESALQGKFTDAAKYSTDLSALEAALIANRIHYQILTTSVTLRESKWSSGQ